MKLLEGSERKIGMLGVLRIFCEVGPSYCVSPIHGLRLLECISLFRQVNMR